MTLHHVRAFITDLAGTCQCKHCDSFGEPGGKESGADREGGGTGSSLGEEVSIYDGSTRDNKDRDGDDRAQPHDFVEAGKRRKNPGDHMERKEDVF